MGVGEAGLGGFRSHAPVNFWRDNLEFVVQYLSTSSV
jgi:hypothetical protein